MAHKLVFMYIYRSHNLSTIFSLAYYRSLFDMKMLHTLIEEIEKFQPSIYSRINRSLTPLVSTSSFTIHVKK